MWPPVLSPGERRWRAQPGLRHAGPHSTSHTGECPVAQLRARRSASAILPPPESACPRDRPLGLPESEADRGKPNHARYFAPKTAPERKRRPETARRSSIGLASRRTPWLMGGSQRENNDSVHFIALG